jgi:hypothetical protein
VPWGKRLLRFVDREAIATDLSKGNIEIKCHPSGIEFHAAIAGRICEFFFGLKPFGLGLAE